MGCKVLTRNVSHFAALLRYMAVKTHILYIYIYIYIYLFIVTRLRFIIAVLFSQHKLYHNRSVLKIRVIA